MASTFEHVFSPDTPRDPSSWAVPKALPVPEWAMDPEAVGEALSSLVKALGPAIIAYARETGVPLPAEVERTEELPPRMVVGVLRQIAGRFFPLLGGR